MLFYICSNSSQEFFIFLRIARFSWFYTGIIIIKYPVRASMLCIYCVRLCEDCYNHSVTISLCKFFKELKKAYCYILSSLYINSTKLRLLLQIDSYFSGSGAGNTTGSSSSSSSIANAPSVGAVAASIYIGGINGERRASRNDT